MLIRALAVALLAAALAGPAQATDRGQIGLALHSSSTSAVGVLWQVSRHFSLEPFVGIDRPSDASADSSLAGAGFRYYLAPEKTVTPYVGSRLAYTHTASYAAAHDTETDRLTGSAVGGLSCSISRHFAVFGDLGFEASRSWQSGASRSRRRTSGATITSAIGAVLYFN